MPRAQLGNAIGQSNFAGAVVTYDPQKIVEEPKPKKDSSKIEEDEFSSNVEFYNNERLHSALNYLPPRDYLEGAYQEKLNKRKEKIRQGYELRKLLNKKMLHNKLFIHIFANRCIMTSHNF